MWIVIKQQHYQCFRLMSLTLKIGEGNGNPLQCSCLENPRDGGAWQAAIYVVAQSQTWLKRLSSSSSTLKMLRNINYLHDTRGFLLFSLINSSALLLTRSKLNQGVTKTLLWPNSSSEPTFSPSFHLDLPPCQASIAQFLARIMLS